MHSKETIEKLRKMHALFCMEIDRQAKEQVARSCGGRLERLTEALRAFTTEPVVTAQFVEMWEDTNGLLPPKIIAELVICVHGSELRHRFDVPTGPLHNRYKPDRLFELCMLRAEADQEIHGDEGDGHALDRMLGLAKELKLENITA